MKYKIPIRTFLSQRCGFCGLHIHGCTCINNSFWNSIRNLLVSLLLDIRKKVLVVRVRDNLATSPKLKKLIGDVIFYFWNVTKCFVNCCNCYVNYTFMRFSPWHCKRSSCHKGFPLNKFQFCTMSRTWHIWVGVHHLRHFWEKLKRLNRHSFLQVDFKV